MGIFQRFLSRNQNSEQDAILNDIRDIFEKEGIPIKNDMIRGTASEFPMLKVYSCKNKCTIIFWLGDSHLTECPLCGSATKFLESLSKLTLTNDVCRKAVAASGHFSHACDCYRYGDLDGALSSLTRAIQLKPDFQDAYYNRSELRIAKGDLSGALDDCNQAIQINPNDADSFVNRGSCRAQAGDFEGGIEDASKALSLGYRGAIAYFNRGLCFFRLMRARESVPDFEKFIELEPHGTRADYVRGLLNFIR